MNIKSVQQILKTSQNAKILNIYNQLNENYKSYTGAQIRKVKDQKDLLKISIDVQQTDLKRFIDIKSKSTFILNKPQNSVFQLDQIPMESPTNIIAESTDPRNQNSNIRLKKGTENEKELFIEVWKSKSLDQIDGFQSSLKVNEKISKVYNDSVFGGFSWDKNGEKIVFVGEKPDIAAFKPYFKDQEEEKKDDKPKENKPEHFQNEKFLHKENFGETLDTKINPKIFIFDLKLNKLNQVCFGKHLSETEYVQYPIFDQDSKGIIFNCVQMPTKKLGLNFCLNKKTRLLYVKDPVYTEDEAEKQNEYIQVLNEEDFMGMQPQFSSDFSKLCYIASTNKFLSHSGNYQLKYQKWPYIKEQKSVTSLDYINEYPQENQEFAGLYGYNQTWSECKFLGFSNRYFLTVSEIKGQHRAYIVDLDQPGQIKWLDFLGMAPQNKSWQGEYTLLSTYEDIAIIKYCSSNEPSKIYAVIFKNLDSAQNLNDIQTEHVLITQNNFVDQELLSAINSIKKEPIQLQNGAQGYIYSLSDEFLKKSVAVDKNNKYPLLTIIHGGPFSSSPQDMFLQQRLFFILQGYQVLVVNYRGSIGYGKDFQDSLLGNIGDNDVKDCGNLTRKVIQMLKEKIDEKRVSVYGGSHGGFLTGWLIGDPEFKDMWTSAVLWNPVLDMTYMLQSTDIPDWIYACSQNKELTDFSSITLQDSQEFFNRSPISQVGNVKTPSLFLVGSGDKRVPPHQSYYYFNCLKSKGVDCLLYNYPESGHALLKSPEHYHDACMNISIWLYNYAILPFVDNQNENEDIKS